MKNWKIIFAFCAIMFSGVIFTVSIWAVITQPFRSTNTNITITVEKEETLEAYMYLQTQKNCDEPIIDNKVYSFVYNEVIDEDVLKTTLGNNIEVVDSVDGAGWDLDTTICDEDFDHSASFSYTITIVNLNFNSDSKYKAIKLTLTDIVEAIDIENESFLHAITLTSNNLKTPTNENATSADLIDGKVLYFNTISASITVLLEYEYIDKDFENTPIDLKCNFSLQAVESIPA